jgi:hypothetical protein
MGSSSYLQGQLNLVCLFCVIARTDEVLQKDLVQLIEVLLQNHSREKICEQLFDLEIISRFVYPSAFVNLLT